MKKTWLITGCSNGLGRHLAEAVLSRGDNLVATARDIETLKDLEDRFAQQVRLAHLDVTRPETAAKAIAVAEEVFGGLDVLVNNAGYGLIGAVEEAVANEYRPLFETNVFGLIEVTRAALPTMRRQGSGRIVNISSGAGIAGSAGSGYYNASKFAVEGLSEALAQEVAPLGIAVIIAKPGPFRTAFLGRSIVVAEQEIPAYSHTSGKRRQYRNTNNGHQAGDPSKAAAVILLAVDSDQPPLHLPIGPAAFGIFERKVVAVRNDFAAWHSVTIATNY